ncbi:MAG: hypothetical protein H7144_00970 [Burkholderiales bacterium]|nr:hypothetical protein [Phycisphaerae bacterium]
MLTVRQMNRLWEMSSFDRLIDELCAGRAESAGGVRQLIVGRVSAAALAVIRLGELHQAHQPLAGKLVRFLVRVQESDGCFGDTAATALCVRALASSDGAGAALTSAVDFLEKLQRDDGEWPVESLRRMPGDPAVTAFVIRQLVESRAPAAVALVDRAVQRLLGETAGDGQLATLRQRLHARKPATTGSWS